MQKQFKFVNAAAKRAFMDLPKQVQRQFGSDLNAVQQGHRPFSDFKDISKSVGVGAIELIENGSPPTVQSIVRSILIPFIFFTPLPRQQMALIATLWQPPSCVIRR